MKIENLVKNLPIFLTNEEKQFVKKYGDNIRLSSLDEHAMWLARNLVRKGYYTTEQTENYLVKIKDD